MKRNILVFGTISGLIISTFMATSMAIMGCAGSSGGSMITAMIIGFASMAAAFVFIFVAIKNYRDKQNNGVISFGKAFTIGILVSLIASTMYVITWAVEFHYFLPDFMDRFTNIQIKQVQESGITGAELDATIKELTQTKEKYENNGFYFAMATYMEILPVGIIMTLIGSLILKRKTAKKQLETEIEKL